MAERMSPIRAAAALAVVAFRVFAPIGAEGQAGVETDRAALEALYTATDGANWTDSTNWLTDAPLAAWHGVTTDDAGRVTGLDLRDNGLTGAIPDALGSLAQLEELNLSWNSLTGPIPDALGSLTKLVVLSLWHNDLTGSVPSWLGELTTLEHLSLSYNSLTGPIPDAVGSLTNLELLSFSINDLTGPIPDALGNLTNLRELFLYRNDLTGPIPDALGNLTNLETLYLHRNWALSGPLPPGLRSAASLDRLNVFVTQACAPAAWRGWLATIRFTGRLCGSETATIATIDVAVVYTPAARRASGGTAAFEAVIDLMIAETNQAMRASGVGHRVALAGRAEVQYVEAGEAQVDLRRLADPSDGHMDGVHVLRDEVGADLVHLIVDADQTDVVGRAYISGAFGLTAHSGGGVNFAHELGHNLGLLHDRYQVHRDEGRAGPHPAYGYVNQRPFAGGAPSSSRWRTIMAYDTQCGDAYISCLQLLRFSNPRQRYRGDPLGVPFADGASGGAGPAEPAGGLLGAVDVEAATPRRSSTRPTRRVGAQVEITGDAVAPRRSSIRPTRRGLIDPTDLARAVGPADAAAVLDVTAPAVALWRDRDARPNRPPTAAGALPDVTLVLPGALTVDVSQAFADPDGDPLTYGASSSAPDVVTATAAGTRVTLTAAGVGAATIRVTAADPGGLSAAQSFTATVAGGPPGSFTDDPIRPGVTPVRAVHFMELRTRIDGLRQAAGLAPFGWTDPVLTAGTPVRLVHLVELRAALATAYAAAGRAAPRWTDAAPTAGTTPIRAAHLMELRAAVTALE